MKSLFVLFLIPFMVSTLFAQIPEQIGYQAVLSNADGTPVTDGNYNLTFRIYADSADGNILWEEDHTNVEVENGVVNIQLGSQNPIDLPFDKPYYLSIQIGTDDPLVPRVPLLASPYSLTAKSVQDSSLTSADLAAGQIVRSINNLKDDVTITGGDNVNVDTNDGKLVISATSTGGEGDGNSLDAADGNPIDAVFVDNAGNVGVGETKPLTTLHVKNRKIGLTASALENDDLLIESEDATLGLYSQNIGNFSSTVAFGEVQDGELLNKWGITRESSNGGGGLRFTYGTDKNYSLNPISMYLDTKGNVGIGTRDLKGKLHVAGNLMVEGEVKVSARTEYVWIAGNAFTPEDTREPNFTLGISMYGGGTGFFRLYGQINVPNGATITEIVAVVLDKTEDFDGDWNIRFYRYNPIAGESDLMAETETTGSVDDRQILTMSSIDHTNVDNANYYYYVSFERGPVSLEDMYKLSVYGVRVEYKISNL
jgi:hypothetical protein